MNVEAVRLETAAQKTIAALDYEPRRARNVGLAVGHGYSSSKHNLDALCAFLASHGFSVVSVDFPGHKLGASGGRLSSLSDLIDTLGAAVAFLRARSSGPVYTVGHSMGATAALLTAAADEQIAGAVSIATGYGRPSALQALGAKGSIDLRSGYVDGLTLQQLVAETEGVLDAALERLAGRPVLYVAAERDGMVSRRSVEELFARAPEPKTFASIDSDHTYAGENARGTILAWLNALHPRDGTSEPLSRIQAS